VAVDRRLDGKKRKSRRGNPCRESKHDHSVPASYVNDRGILAQNGVSRRKILYPSDLVVELVILEARLLLEWFSVHWEQTSLLSI
jgi:hypothetical protein